MATRASRTEDAAQTVHELLGIAGDTIIIHCGQSRFGAVVVRGAVFDDIRTEYALPGTGGRISLQYFEAVLKGGLHAGKIEDGWPAHVEICAALDAIEEKLGGEGPIVELLRFMRDASAERGGGERK